MKIKKSLTPIIILSLSMLLHSCSKIEKMGENATLAAENSGKAAEAASESREEIAQSRLMGRSGAASASRREALESLMEMKTFPMKVTEASKYVKAFEFQLWTGQKYETSIYKQRLYEDAMSELFRSVEELYGEPIANAKLSPFKALSGAKNKNLNIYALAVSLHGEHQHQEIKTKNKANAVKESMYSVIKDALIKIDKVSKGIIGFSSLTRHEEIVYNYRDEAIALISARYNMLLVMNLAKVSDLKKNTLNGLKLLYVSKSFSSKFSMLNIGEQDEVNRYLDAALKVKVFMNQIGEEIILDAKVKKLYSKMYISKTDTAISTSSMDSMAKKTQLMNIKQHIALLKELELK